MTSINLTSTTGSGYLETDFDQIKDLIQDGGVEAVVFKVLDNGFTIADNADITKLISFQASGITTATTRTITMPDTDVDLGNLDTTNVSAATLVTESDTIASNDNDTTLPTSAAVKDYSDNATATLTNKTINAANNTSEIAVEVHTTSDTLTAAECYGKVHYVSSAATLTLPAVADGMHLTVITIGAVAVSVDPNASDLIYLDGTALDDGDKITNTSTAGDIAVLTYYDATGWHASTNTWTDGGA